MTPRYPEWVKKAIKIYEPYEEGVHLSDDAPDEAKNAFEEVNRWYDEFFEKQEF